jgi:hypothetical protein
MAVTISEMHVDVQQAPLSAAAPAKGDDKPKKDMSFTQALEMLRERALRLEAD